MNSAIVAIWASTNNYGVLAVGHLVPKIHCPVSCVQLYSTTLLGEFFYWLKGKPKEEQMLFQTKSH